jgi:hypothetical protein
VILTESAGRDPQAFTALVEISPLLINDVFSKRLN